jgi:hypothetical protein
MHAALFQRPNVVSLRAPLPARPEATLESMQSCPLLLDLAAEGRARPRRLRPPVAPAPGLRAALRKLLKRCEAMGRPDLAGRVARAGLVTVDRPLFARKLAQLGAAA